MRPTIHPRSWKSALAASAVVAATIATPISAGAASGGFAENDAFETTEDATPRFLGVLSNDDPAAVITGFTPATNGTVAEVVANGITIGYTYEPSPDTNGPDSFTYTIEVDVDGVVSVDTAEVTIGVAAVPDAPIAADDSAPAPGADPIEEDGPAVDLTDLILANDTDADGDARSIVGVDTSSTKGTVTFSAGRVEYEATDQAATTDSFGYTIRDDSDGQLESAGTVTITIVPNDDAPVGSADEAVVDESDSVSIPVLANDEDIDGGDKSIASVSAPAIGTAEISGTEVLYTAPEEIATETEVTFTYQLGPTGASDGDVVDITVTVSPVDDAPVAVADEAEVDEAGTVVIPVLINDEDVDGGPIEITEVTDPATGLTEFDTTTITYTHEGDSLADVTFDYTINGGSTATVTVSVLNADDDVPVVDDVELELAEDATATVVPVLTPGQTDVDGTLLEISDWTDPSIGTVDLTEGVLTYAPNADANGADSFVVTVTDGTNNVDVVVDVMVTPVNDAPVAGDDSYTDTMMYWYDAETIFVLEDEQTVLPLLGNDSDIDSESLDVVVESIEIDPSIGSVTATEGGVRFTPAADWSGWFSFTYVVSDGELESELASVDVFVIPMSDAPVAVQDTAGVSEDGVVYVDVLANDYDVDNGSFDGPIQPLRVEQNGPGFGGLEVIEVSQPEHGYAVIAGDRIRVEADPDFNGELVIEYRVRSEYEPFWDPHYGSSTYQCSNPFGPYGFDFGPFNSRQASSVLDPFDDSSFCQTTIGTLVVDVDMVNDAPIAVNDVGETDEDVAVTIDVLGNDSDIDGDDLSIWGVGDAQRGSTEVDNDQIIFTPDQDFNGEDAFVYFVTDGDLVRLATVEVAVLPINDAPTVDDVEFEIDEDESASFTVVVDDVEDAPEDLSISLGDGPAVGDVEITGTAVIYTPPADYHGEVSFELVVEDSDGASDIGTVDIVVASVNDLPTVSNVTGEIDEDDVFEFTLDADDVEDGAELSVDVGEEPADGTVEVDGLDVVYAPPANWNGEASFTLVVTDSDDGEATATVTVEVAPVNDPPTASDIAVVVDEDGSVTFDLETEDVDGDELTLSLVEPPQNLGEVAFDGNAITWAPSANFNGELVWNVRVGDGEGLSAVAEIVGNVNSVNDAPVISPASAEVEEDGSVDIEIQVSDIDGDLLTIAVVDGPTRGQTEINGLVVTYAPNPDANGADTFVLKVTDKAGATAQATVSIDVAPLQDAPTAVACGPYSVEEGKAIVIEADNCAADVDGDSLTITPASVTVSAGSVEVADKGDSLTFTAPAEAGVASVGFTIVDGKGGQVEVSVSMTVTPAPSPYVGTKGLEGEVVRLYSAMLGREPDAQGFAFWVGQRTDGMTFEQMVNHFAASPEFISIYGNRIQNDTDQQWVAFVYREIMGRSADAGGQVFWLAMLRDGTYSRAAMVIVFSQSPEFRFISGTN